MHHFCANSLQIWCPICPNPYQSSANPLPILPILCQSSAIPLQVYCQCNTNPMRCDVNPVPIICQFEINPSPICLFKATLPIQFQSTNPGPKCNLPILDLSPSPMPIHEQSTHPNILNHYPKLSPIHGQSSTPGQSAKPMPILGKSDNLIKPISHTWTRQMCR